MTIKRFITLFVLSISWCWADANQIKQLLQSALSEHSTVPPPTAARSNSQGPSDEIYSELSHPVLTASEVESLLPLAVECVSPSHPQANPYGIAFLSVVALRADAIKLLQPYLDQFDAIASGPGGPLRTSNFTILVLITPRWDSYGVDPRKPESERLAKSNFADAVARAAKVISILNNHLEDKTNSRDDVVAIAEALIKASPSDAAMIHKVLSVAEKQSEVHVTIAVVNALGLSRTHNPEALDFISKGLDSADRNMREQSIQAVGSLDRDVRVGFVANHAVQFGRLAADPAIGHQFQTMAADALSSREMIR